MDPPPDSERTFQRRIKSFQEYDIEGFLSAETARHRKLTPNVRRLIVDLKDQRLASGPSAGCER
jgi:hypothetical protein